MFKSNELLNKTESVLYAYSVVATVLNTMADCDHNSTSYFNECNTSFAYPGYVNSTFNESTNHTGPVYLDPSYYSMNYRIVGTVFQGIVFIVGVLGNIMVVIVVWQTRSMHTPTNCYLVSLSIADFMVLIASVPIEILGYYLLGDEWILGRWGCAIFVFLQYFGINASSLSITAFTVERYIAICHPMKAQMVCTVNRAKKIIIGVWIFAAIYCCPWLILTKIEPIYYKGHQNKETCTFALSREHYAGYFFTDLVLFYILPLILSCILYGLIARILFSNEIPKTPGKKNGTPSVSTGDSKKTNSSTNARVQKY